MKKQFFYQIKTKGSGLNLKTLYKKYDVTEGSYYGRNKNEYVLTLTDTTRFILSKYKNVVDIKEKLIRQKNMNIFLVIQKKGHGVQITMVPFQFHKKVIK